MLLRFLFLATLALFNPSTVEAQQEKALTDQTDAADTGWVELVGDDGAVGLKKIAQGVTQCGDVSVSANSKVLTAIEGTGVLAALKKVKNGNVFSKQAFGDCEVQLEFLIGKGSNSGIKLH